MSLLHQLQIAIFYLILGTYTYISNSDLFRSRTSFSWCFTSGLGFLENSKLFRVVKTWWEKNISTFDVYTFTDSFFETQRTLQFSGYLCTPGSHPTIDFVLLLATSSIVASPDKRAHMLDGVAVNCHPHTSSWYNVIQYIVTEFYWWYE